MIENEFNLYILLHLIIENMTIYNQKDLLIWNMLTIL